MTGEAHKPEDSLKTLPQRQDVGGQGLRVATDCRERKYAENRKQGNQDAFEKRRLTCNARSAREEINELRSENIHGRDSINRIFIALFYAIDCAPHNVAVEASAVCGKYPHIPCVA